MRTRCHSPRCHRCSTGKSGSHPPLVPERLKTSLNVESGLNDGLCVPLLLLAIALSKTDADPAGLAIKLLVQEIGIGALVGITLTLICSSLIHYSEKNQWISSKWAQIPVTALSLICFTVAQELHGSGYIAAFVGGLTFCILNRRKRSHELTHDAEESGDILSMLTWILFGAVAIHGFIENFSLTILGYALLSLTLIRILPVMISLTKSDTNGISRLFLSWFGPRGLASVVFAVIIINSGIPQAEPIAHVITCTILLSVLAHGMTAVPFIKKFSNSMH
ncbi:cation:proton antiporter [Rubritalea tangerina]|uniref:Cation:proton antiporter n=1 Tax=Rubritalea tangerina TaxID=430798 RepID=A0ABW4ZCC0_9BACT